jgi:hypothetical protein
MSRAPCRKPARSSAQSCAFGPQQFSRCPGTGRVVGVQQPGEFGKHETTSAGFPGMVGGIRRPAGIGEAAALPVLLWCGGDSSPCQHKAPRAS